MEVAKMSVCVLCLCFLSGKRTKCHKSVTMCRKVPHSPPLPPKRVVEGGSLGFLLLCAWCLAALFMISMCHTRLSQQKSQPSAKWSQTNRNCDWLQPGERERRSYSAVAGGLISSVRKVADKGSGLAWPGPTLFCYATHSCATMPRRQTDRQT